VHPAWRVAPDWRCPTHCGGGTGDLEVRILSTLSKGKWSLNGKGVRREAESEGS